MFVFKNDADFWYLVVDRVIIIYNYVSVNI